MVYKALDLHTDRFVALKRLKADAEGEGVPAHALREFTLLKRLQSMGHPNIVTLENVLMENSRIYLAFELMEGDLKQQMDSQPFPHALSPALTHSYCEQILNGLAFIHSRGVMHRDLKPQNLLVNSSSSQEHGFTIKIADFGLARTFSPNARPLSMEVITRWYRPPEILLGSPLYSSSVDLWGVACILAEMSRGHALFASDSDIDQLHRIFRLLGTPNSQTWPEFSSLPHYRNSFPQWTKLSLSTVLPGLPAEGVDFIESIFQYQPNKRMNAVEALSHPYITKFRSVAFSPRSEGHREESEIIPHQDDNGNESFKAETSVGESNGVGEAFPTLSQSTLTRSLSYNASLGVASIGEVHLDESSKHCDDGNYNEIRDASHLMACSRSNEKKKRPTQSNTWSADDSFLSKIPKTRSLKEDETFGDELDTSKKSLNKACNKITGCRPPLPRKCSGRR